MDEQRLAELERLANQATPGPWHYKEGLMFKHYVYSDNEDLKVSCAPLELSFQEFSSYDGRDVPGKENAQFIAASREAIPELIAEIRALKAQLANAATHAEVQAGQAREALLLDLMQRLPLANAPIVLGLDVSEFYTIIDNVLYPDIPKLKRLIQSQEEKVKQPSESESK